MVASPASFTRVESLDYLRGLLAVAVMLYHYVSWSGPPLDAESLLGRLGIYAVSTFYILSGLSLSLVYRNKLVGVAAVRRYAVHRVFRIAPLFWFAVTTALTMQIVSSVVKESVFPDLNGWWIFLNYSLLFGFVQPDAYFSPGAWSIGNEMVFYALFPVLVLAGRPSRWVMLVALCLSLVGAWFLTRQINDSVPLAQQWSSYINPLNQLPFFIAGMLIAEVGCRDAKRSPAIGLSMFAAGVLLFALIPAHGDAVALVVVPARAEFFVACVLVVAGVYHADILITQANRLGRAFASLGALTYSIYLLHPFTPAITTRVFGDGWLGYASAAVGTIIVSYASFRWLERPMMQLGRRMASGMAPEPGALRGVR